MDGVLLEGPPREILEEGAREGGREVQVEGVVEAAAGVGGDPFNVVGSGTDEVDGGDVGHLLSLLVDAEVEGDAMLPEVVDADQRREDAATEGIHDQDLVHLLVRASARRDPTAGVRRLVQIEHPDDMIYRNNRIKDRKYDKK